MRIFVSVLAVMLLLITACKKNDANPSTTLSLSRSLVKLGNYTGNADTFKINAKVAWKFTISPASATSWLQTDTTAGPAGTTIIKVSIKADNVSGVAQNATIKVTPVDAASPSVSLTVVQSDLYTMGRSKTIGGTGFDVGRSVIKTADGGYIVAGLANSTDMDIHNARGRTDGFVVKCNAAGDTLWTKDMGGSSDDYLLSIAAAADGGFFATGYTGSNDKDIHNAKGSNDGWVVKLKNNGDTLWTKNIGGSKNDYFYSVTATADGGCIVVGSIAGYAANSTDGDITGVRGRSDGFVAKLGSNGNIQWTKTIGGSNDDGFYAVAATADGGCIAAGSSYSNDKDIHGAKGAGDAFLVKLKSNGDTLWTKNMGGSADDYFLSIAAATDGGFFAAGYTASNDKDVHNAKGGTDGFVVKLASNSDILWTKNIGGTAFDYFQAVVPAADGSCIAAGYTSSSDIDIHDVKGSNDALVVKLNGSGMLQWTKNMGGSAADAFYAITPAGTDEFIAAGATLSHDGDVTGSKGGADIWIVGLK